MTAQDNSGAIPADVLAQAEAIGEAIHGRHERGWVCWPLITNAGPSAVEIVARGILAERERCAAAAHAFLINWASDLSDTRDAYIEAQNTGTFSGRRMSRATAIGFAHTFRERSEAVADCADDVVKAIRGSA